MNDNPCQRCGNNHEDATPYAVLVDGHLMTLDLGCIADLRLTGHRVVTDPGEVRKVA